MSTSDILLSLKSAPKLCRASYKKWSNMVQLSLIGMGLERIILEDLKELSEKDQTTIRQDAKVRAALTMLVPDDVYYLIESKMTARHMWTSLQDFYRSENHGDIDALLQDFWSFTMDEDTDIDIFAHGLTEIQSKIALADPSQRPSSMMKKNRLLNHFDQIKDGRYSGCVSVLRLNTLLSFEDCVNALRSTQGSIKRFEIKTEPTILLTKGDGSPQAKVCAHCKRKGHIRESCFVWIDTPEGSKWATKNPGKASKVFKRKSMFLKKRSNANDEKEKPGSSIDGVWMAGDNVFSRSGNISTDVVLDTGATRHIFCDKAAFVTFRPTRKSIQTASGQNLTVSGIGSVEFRVLNFTKPKITKVVHFDNVWYVPECTKNLLSGTQLLAENFGISSNSKGLSITTSDGKVYATARPICGLFRFNTSRFPYYSTPENFVGFCSDVNVVHTPIKNSFSTYSNDTPLSVAGFPGKLSGSTSYRYSGEHLFSCVEDFSIIPNNYHFHDNVPSITRDTSNFPVLSPSQSFSCNIMDFPNLKHSISFNRNLGYHPLGPIRTNNCINSHHYLYTNPWATLKKKKKRD